jgi:hypothetical protein
LEEAEEDCHFRAALSRSFEYWSNVSRGTTDYKNGGVEKGDVLANVQYWDCSFRADTIISKSSSGCERCDRKE